MMLEIYAKVHAGLGQKITGPSFLLCSERGGKVCVDRPGSHCDRRFDKKAIFEKRKVIARAQRKKQLKPCLNLVVVFIKISLSQGQRVKSPVNTLPKETLVDKAYSMASD